MLGVEVEISATGQDDRRSHKDVLEREINGRPAYTAVFDNIREGSYTLWVETSRASATSSSPEAPSRSWTGPTSRSCGTEHPSASFWAHLQVLFTGTVPPGGGTVPAQDPSSPALDEPPEISPQPWEQVLERSLASWYSAL